MTFSSSSSSSLLLPVTEKDGKKKKEGSVAPTTTTRSQSQPPLPDGWNRCHAYIARKHRYCRQMTLSNANYCGNHQEWINNNNNNINDCTKDDTAASTYTTTAANNVVTKAAVNSNNNNKRKRIPCPLDKSHTIYEDCLLKHLKICPKLKLQQQEQNLIYYKKNINTGGYGNNEYEEHEHEYGNGNGNGNDAINTNYKSNDEKNNNERIQNAKQLALKVLLVHQKLFSTTMATAATAKTVSDLTVKDIEAALPLKDFSSMELNDQVSNFGLAQSIESYHIRSGGPKHMQQQASLLGHLRRLTYTNTSTLSYSTDTNIENSNTFSSAKNGIQQQKYLDKKYSNSNSKSDNDSDNNNKEYLILELGAGRGMFGLISAAAFAATNATSNNNDVNAEPASIDLIMIERTGTRSKADTILRNHKSTLQGRCLMVENIRHWERIQCDLAHLHMPTVLLSRQPQQQQQQQQQQEQQQQIHKNTNINRSGEEKVHKTSNNDDNDNNAPSSADGSISKNNNTKPKTVLAVAKHLCGAGTDLALKSLYPIRDQLEVCVMATCCHGLCTWKDYVGRDYLEAVMAIEVEDEQHPTQPTNNNNNDEPIPVLLNTFGKQKFDLLRLWSSGTVKDHNNDGSSNTARTGTASFSTKKGTMATDDDGGDGASENSSSSTTTNNKKDEDELHNYKTDERLGLVSVSTVVEHLNLRCGEQGLGRACQRLIDYGRQQYLQQVLFAKNYEVPNSENTVVKSELCYYVPSSVTPQNAVLLAARERQDTC